MSGDKLPAGLQELVDAEELRKRKKSDHFGGDRGARHRAMNAEHDTGAHRMEPVVACVKCMQGKGVPAAPSTVTPLGCTYDMRVDGMHYRIRITRGAVIVRRIDLKGSPHIPECIPNAVDAARSALEALWQSTTGTEL